jgi:hypothetical protein|nr:MAG TPA: tail protein [Caudoviricetes sp.]
MIKKRVNKINWHGSDLENNRAKAPNISTPGGNGLDGLNDGEIYVCNADEDPAIFIKTNKDKVARVGGNGSDSYSRDQIDDFLGKKLDKVVWDRNLEERVDDNGKEYLFLTKPLITAYGVTMYAGADVQVPSIYEGLPIDGVTIQWVDGKLVATGGKGTANGIVVNGDTYTPNEDGIITLPNYPSLSGYATEQWVNNTLSGYATSSSLSQLSAKVDNFLEGTDTDGIINKWKELESFLAGQTQTSTLAELLSVKADKATTLAGYGITDAYTKNDISGLLADYVTKSGAQDITGVKSFINGLNIGDILVKKHSDGVVELDGDLILTGSLTMFAQGSHTASTILDALPIDETTLSKEGGVLSVIGGVGGGSVDGIILNGTTYSPDETTKLITLPNYPTTLPASDVYSWAKQPNKPSYSFGELSSHPTTLGGYGITDAYTKTDADGKYVLKAGDTITGKLLFNANSSIDLVYIPRTKSAISFNNAGSNRIGINSTDGDGNLRIAKTDINQDWVSGDVNILLGSNNYKVLHTGNYAGELDNRYVNKIGDAMTGNLVFAHTSERPSYSGSIGITFREQIANGQGVKLVYNDYDNYRAPAGLILVGEQGGEYFEAPAIYQNGYKVWDAGNKRDMFSSMNEAFTTWGNEQVISVEGDANTYYPVVITINHSKTWNSRIAIHKNLGSRTPSYPGNHGNGTSSMWAMYEGRYSGWDGNSGYIVTKYVRQPYANLISKAEHAGNSVGALVVYLRGGGCEYTVCTDYRGGINVYYERTEISGDSNYPVYVEPTTSVGNQGVLNMVSYDYLVQKAVRLETPRSLWGQTFDGTGNVNGTIHVNSGGIYPIILRNSGGSECSIDYQCSGEHFVAGVYPDRFFIWRENGGEIASFLSNGNVGIGTTSPSQKLHVNGGIGVNGTIMFDYLSGGNERNLLYQQMADNDLFRIRCGGSSNQGWVEIATADDGTEPIYVRQYTGAFSSVTRTLTLLDGSGNTICPGNLLTNGGITMYSDLRKKNVLNSIIVPLDVMSNADLFDYTFKTDEKGKVRAGTSAQYWSVFLPQVTDTDNEGFFTMSYDVLATTCVLSMAKHFQRFLIEDFGRHETEIERLKRENEDMKNRIIELERRAA